LKPLENPPPSTLWILGSMNPEKLTQAVKNRASQFVLNLPDKPDLMKYVKRIAKGEQMSYMTDELLALVVENSNREMRSAALLMQAIDQYVAGSSTKKVTKAVVEQALNSSSGSDDKLSVTVLAAVYHGKFKAAQRALLDVQDGFRFI